MQRRLLRSSYHAWPDFEVQPETRMWKLKMD